MASIVVDVPCGEETHRLELRDDGTARMLDHDPRVVAAFTRMGATPPECARAVAEYERKPLAYILSHTGLDGRTVGLLACDYAEHVLSIFEAKFPDDIRPRKAIKTARACGHGEATAKQLYKWWAAAQWASTETVKRAWAAKMAAVSAEEAAEATLAWAAEEAAEEAAGAVRAAAAAWAAEEAAAWAAEEAARAARGCLGAALTAETEARVAEAAWQLKHTFKVLNALEEGLPWPAL
jgi:hypothetical protein